MEAYAAVTVLNECQVESQNEVVDTCCFMRVCGSSI